MKPENVARREPPFAGLRIVELGGAVPASAATKRFADFGADVIKVEPPGGAPVRRLRPFPDDRPQVETGTFHVALDTGKRSMALDVVTPSGREVLRRLVARVELVVSDLPVDQLRIVRELLNEPSTSSLVTITPHGLEGPYAERLENDASLFGWSTRAFNQRGMASEGERGPLRYAPFLAEIQVGCTAAAVAAAIVWARRRDGLRRVVDLSAVEALTGNVDSAFFLHAMTGTTETYSRPEDTGTRTYSCLDGHVLMLQVTQEPTRSRVCGVLGASTTESASNVTVEELLSVWLARRTKQQAFEVLQEAGVIAAPILDASELLADPQTVKRDSYVDVPHPTLGMTTIAGPPFRFVTSDGVDWEAHPAPSLGAHTQPILEELGYSPAEQIALAHARVVL